MREKTAEEKEAEEAAADAEDEAQVLNLYLLPHSLPSLQGQVQWVQQLQADGRTHAARGERCKITEKARWWSKGEQIRTKFWQNNLTSLSYHQAVSQSQRWKKKKAGAVEDPKEKENKEQMLKLTGIADEILTRWFACSLDSGVIIWFRSGNMEIYEMTYEGILFKIKAEEEKKVGHTF